MTNPFTHANNVYTGGEEYFLKFENGNHAIKRVTFYGDKNEIVFVGHYDACIERMKQIIIDNADYDLNL